MLEYGRYGDSAEMDYNDPDHDLPAYTGPPAAIAPVRRQAWTRARVVHVMTLVAIIAAIVAALCCGWVLVTMCLEMQP